MSNFSVLFFSYCLLFSTGAAAECSRQTENILSNTNDKAISQLNSYLLPVEFDPSVPEDFKELVLKDLEWMSKIQGDSATPLHWKKFGSKVDGKVYLEFFKKQVDRIALNQYNCGGFNNVACFNSSTKTLLFPKDLLSLYKDYPQTSRVSILIHEADHFKSLDHSNCTPVKTENSLDALPIVRSNVDKDILAPENRSCDDSAGAYVTQALFAYNLATLCTNCSRNEKSDAETAASYALKRVQSSPIRSAMQADWLGVDPTRLFLKAAEFGKTQAVESYVQAGADIHAKAEPYQNQAAHLAAIRGYIDLLSFLKTRGANLKAENSLGQAPIEVPLIATFTDAYASFHYLLSTTSDPQDPDNTTYLSKALHQLIANGIDNREELKKPDELESALSSLIQLGANPYNEYPHFDQKLGTMTPLNAFQLAEKKKFPEVSLIMEKAFKKSKERELLISPEAERP